MHWHFEHFVTHCDKSVTVSFVCQSTDTETDTDTQTHINTDTQTHRHRHTDTHTHTDTDTHTQTHTHTYKETNTYTTAYKHETCVHGMKILDGISAVNLKGYSS